MYDPQNESNLSEDKEASYLRESVYKRLRLIELGDQQVLEAILYGMLAKICWRGA